jgi:DNA-binding Lrp family transcriptional regulator
MEESGVIAGYDLRVDMAKLGFSGAVFVSIELTSQAEHVLRDFEQEVVKCPSISYCGFVSGDTDFLILIHVSSFNEYDMIYRQELSILPHVSRIRSSFVLRQVARHANPTAILQKR